MYDEIFEGKGKPLAKAATSKIPLKRLVMPDFTSSEWQKFAKTPAGGDAYYNASLDQSAIKYRGKTLLYYSRIAGSVDKWAACFSECKVFRA